MVQYIEHVLYLVVTSFGDVEIRILQSLFPSNYQSVY
jgi:hypothetical protein